MTLSVAEQHRRIAEHNAKVAERNLIMNKMLAICDTPKTAGQITDALNISGAVLGKNISILVRSGYLKACGMVLIDKYRKRTQYVTMKYNFDEGYKTETCQLIERNPNNPNMRIVRGSDHIIWTPREGYKQEVRIGSTMGML